MVIISKLIDKFKKKKFLKNDVDLISAKKLGPKTLDINKNIYIRKYITELYQAIKDPEIHNISLSGGYGSGKSTIIENYKNYYCKKKDSLTISTSSFINLNNLDEDGFEYPMGYSKNDINELNYVDKIEKSILKQLVYQNYSNEMRGSSLKRVESNKSKIFRIIYLTYICIVPLFCFIFNFLNKYVKNVYDKIFFRKIFNNENLLAIILIVYLIFLVVLVERIIKLIFENKNIRIKVSNNELSLDNKQDLIFSKKLNEIIYFFSKNKIKVVFFEDIDRFHPTITLMVIEELKELNRILVEARVVKIKPTFVYAFKDDIFLNYEDRSKFYDFNISVIPISTSYNSLVNLYNIIDNNGVDENGLNKVVLQDVAKYVHDYRTLINIVGDYSNFKNIILSNNKKVKDLKIKNQDSENQIRENSNLFALMAIKNVNISEYSKISEYENDIFNEIKRLHKLIDYKIDVLSNEIRKLEKEKNIFEDDIVKLKEKLITSSGYSIDYKTNIKYDGINYNVRDFCKKVEITKESDILTIDNNEINLDDYKEIKNSIYNSQDEIRRRKINITRNEIKLENVKNNNYDYNFYSDESNNNAKFNLLDDLICHGFIDEKFISYATSPVLNDNFSVNDNMFLLNINHGIMDFNLKLDNPKNIIKYLNNPKNSFLLNNDFINYLVDYCLKNNFPARNKKDYRITKTKLLDKHFIILNEVVKLFEKIDDNSFTFLEQYRTNSNFIYLLEFIFSNAIDLIESLHNYSINKNFVSNFKIQKMLPFILKVNNLVSYVEDLEYLRYLIETSSLRAFDINILFDDEISKKNILDLNVNFVKLNEFKELNFKYIVENNLYKINKNNIEIIYHKNIEKIRLSSNKIVLEYVLKKYNFFGREIYLKYNLKFNNKNICKKFLDYRDLDIDFRKKIYEKENILLKDIDELCINEILKYNRLNATWENISKLLDIVEAVNIKRVFEYILLNREKLFVQIKDISNRKIENIMFMLLDQKYYKEFINCLDFLKDYDSYKMDVKKMYPLEFINDLVKRDLINYTKQNYILMDNEKSKNIKIIFVKNAFRSIGYKAFKFGAYNPYEILAVVDKISLSNLEIINKAAIFYKNNFSKEESKRKMKIIFNNMFMSNNKYEITCKRNIYTNVFESYSTLFKSIEYKKGTILIIYDKSLNTIKN